jgi:hypothetical protein
MRTLLSVAIFAMVWCAGFSGDDSFAAERNAPTAKKYASTGSAPYKSFADIVTAAHKKKSDVKSEGNGTSRSSKISYAKTKSPKKIRGLRTGSSSKSLSNKSRSTKSLSASKKRYIKKLSLLKSKGSGKSLKNKSHTRDYSVKPKRSKDRTKRKTIAHE